MSSYEVTESAEFLVSKLKKDFPGFKLRPHTKLLIAKEGAIPRDKQKATIRYEKSTIRYPSSNRIPLIESSLEYHEHREDMGMIEIVKMEVKKFKNLGDQDATDSGHFSLQKLKAFLHRVYGPIRDEEFVSVYYFK